MGKGVLPDFLNTARTVAPCKGCTQDVVKPQCHDVCQDFLAWKAEGDRVKKNRKEYKDKPFSKIT